MKKYSPSSLLAIALVLLLSFVSHAITIDQHQEPAKLGEFSWSIPDISQRYKPRWKNANKQIVADMAGTDENTTGIITASRWALSSTRGIPTTTTACTNATFAQGFYQYAESSQDDQTTHWHVNFADPYLFGYAEGPLLAQDELQVVEHPTLLSVAKAMEHGHHHGVSGLKRQTRRPTNILTATPVLIQNAPRRCRLDTSNIYGDSFATASPDTIRDAVKLIRPPTRSNIVAIVAIQPNHGTYTREQIQELYHTAYIGFHSVALTKPHATIHTGHWGCGAFGGNKGLLATLQILAAAAGVDRLVCWYGHTTMDRTAVEHGQHVASFLQGKGTGDAIDLLVSAGYRWGNANENHVTYEPPSNDLLRRSDEL